MAGDEVAKALDRLSDLIEKAEKRAEEEKQERARLRDLRRQHPDMPESSLYDILEGRYEEVGREQGIFGKMMASSVPSGKVALGAMGYARGYQGGRMGKALERAMGFGEMFRQYGSPYAAAGADIYDSSGKTISYSSGDLGRLSDDERKAMGDWRYANLSAEEIAALTPEQADALKNYNEQVKNGKASSSARKKLEEALPLQDILGKGVPLSKAVEAGIPGAATLAKVPGLAGLMGSAGAAMQLGARFAGGPATVAYKAAETAYKTADALYDPARSAAGLGYGFSYNPFSTGFQTSLNRSIATKLDAFGSFGLSQQQTAAARAAIEGMGAGGPGSERMYDSYYKSMTDVMENTQMSAQSLSPFYEQFMRQGGTEDQIGSLTKMLRDDLPKAAAASRMSLEGMAQMIQKTTEAASASPYNYRTKTEISQALVSTQAAGAPPGFANIAGGTNSLVTAQTASRLGIDYFEAMGNAGALQVTAAQGVQGMLGDMTGDQFREYRQTGEGRIKAFTTAQMYGLSVDDIQKLYDQGIKDFEVSASLNDEFSSSNLGKEKTVKKRIGSPGGARGGGTSRVVDAGVSQKVIGKDLDLYKDQGSKVQSVYATSIEAIRESFSDMGDQESLDKFNEDLKNLSGKEGKKTWDVLQSASQKIGKDTATDQQGGKDGVITLSDEAKKYFKLEFGSSAQNPNPANSNWGSGGTSVG
jgi:hypothetical protein